MGVTSIAWTDRSVNPIRARLNGHVGHHCEKVSAGCLRCYASRLQSRFKMPEFRADQRRGVEVFFDDARLREVLTRRKPTKWFWCDMTDLFGDWVEEAWIDKVFAVCALTPQHTHQILTKRPERMRAYLQAFSAARVGLVLRQIAYDTEGRPEGGLLQRADIIDEGWCQRGGWWPLPNVWLGVSVEDQATADQRIPILLQTPAAVRWVSAEPLLGPVDFNRVPLPDAYLTMCGYTGVLPAKAEVDAEWDDFKYSQRKVCTLDWVVVGGESGPKARPCNVAWIRSVVEQCKAASVPVFVKQLGAHVVDRNDAGFDGGPGDNWTETTRFDDLTEQGWQGDPVRIRLRDRKGGDPSEWPEDLRVREFPEATR